MMLKEELPGIATFLNRLLSLKIDRQNILFEAFSNRLDANIQKAIAEGTLDLGTETVRADRISKVAEQVVYTEPNSGAQTKHVQFLIGHKNEPTTFDDLLASGSATAYRKVEFFATNVQSGRTYAFTDAENRTEGRTGSVVAHYHQVGPVGRHPIPQHELLSPGRWRRIEKEEIQTSDTGIKYRAKVPDYAVARAVWDARIKELPEYSQDTLNLICGAVLPIWDRLRGEAKVKRLQTNDGERFLGRVIPDAELDDTLKNLGVELAATEWTPENVIDRLEAGTHYFKLVNGWNLKRSTIAKERRYELVGPTFRDMAIIQADGVFFERIDYKARFFVPTGSAAATVLGKILASKPVAEAQRVG